MALGWIFGGPRAGNPSAASRNPENRASRQSAPVAFAKGKIPLPPRRPRGRRRSGRWPLGGCSGCEFESPRSLLLRLGAAEEPSAYSHRPFSWSRGHRGTTLTTSGKPRWPEPATAPARSPLRRRSLRGRSPGRYGRSRAHCRSLSMSSLKRTLQAVKIAATDRRIPRPLRGLAALGLAPIPGPFDEALLLIVAIPLVLFYREPLADAWRQANTARPS